MRMQFIKYILSLGISLILISPAHAIMVKYVDEFGKIHYVDTDYTNVPEKYYYQVKDQIEKAKKDDASTSPADEKSIVKTSLEKKSETEQQPPFILSPAVTQKEQTKQVELFVKTDCSQCFLLESVLRQRKIIYQKYDIESDLGRDKYRALGVHEVPVTKVGSEIIVGFDLNGIYTALNEK